jgi:hypothetical protein
VRQGPRRREGAHPVTPLAMVGARNGRPSEGLRRRPFPFPERPAVPSLTPGDREAEGRAHGLPAIALVRTKNAVARSSPSARTTIRMKVRLTRQSGTARETDRGLELGGRAVPAATFGLETPPIACRPRVPGLRQLGPLGAERRAPLRYAFGDPRNPQQPQRGSCQRPACRAAMDRAHPRGRAAPAALWRREGGRADRSHERRAAATADPSRRRSPSTVRGRLGLGQRVHADDAGRGSQPLPPTPYPESRR